MNINKLPFRNDGRDIIVINYFAGDTGFFNGVCFSWSMMDLMRVTSLLARLDFGLKSQSLEIRSHSVPGSISSDSATNCFSAFLDITNTSVYQKQ